MDWTGRWSSCKQWEAEVGWAADMGGLKKGKAVRRGLDWPPPQCVAAENVNSASVLGCGRGCVSVCVRRLLV